MDRATPENTRVASVDEFSKLGFYIWHKPDYLKTGRVNDSDWQDIFDVYIDMKEFLERKSPLFNNLKIINPIHIINEVYLIFTIDGLLES